VTTWFRFGGQAIAYALFAVAIGYFANAPAFTHFPPDQGLIRLSFSHAAHRVGECRRLTPEELAKLAPNMRKPLDCPRGRLPVYVELTLDGETVYQASLPPTGIFGDSPSRVHKGFPVSPGPHRIEVRMRNSARTAGFDYQRVADIIIAPQQNFVIDFRATSEGFVFR
jgi:hypothetical protein